MSALDLRRKAAQERMEVKLKGGLEVRKKEAAIFLIMRRF